MPPHLPPIVATAIATRQRRVDKTEVALTKSELALIERSFININRRRV